MYILYITWTVYTDGLEISDEIQERRPIVFSVEIAITEVK